MNWDLIFGIGFAVLSGVIGFLIKRDGLQDERMAKLEDKLAAHVRHTAENYVRGHEIAEVKRAISDLRTEMTGMVNELRKEVTHEINELTKAVNQMIGQNNAK